MYFVWVSITDIDVRWKPAAVSLLLIIRNSCSIPHISTQIKVQIGVRHCCALTPYLFNTYADIAMRNMKPAASCDTFYSFEICETQFLNPDMQTMRFIFQTVSLSQNSC